jgi:hypothetical protein
VGKSGRQPQRHRFGGEQAQGPPFPPCRGRTTRHRNQMGLSFAGEARWGSGPWSFRQRFEVFFHKPLARSLDCHGARCYLLRNFFIAQPFIGLQQNARARHLAGSRLADPDDVHERVPLFRR